MQTFDKYKLIDISEKHRDLLYNWRNSDHVRCNMYTERLITKEEHNRWFESLQSNPRHIAKLLMYLEKPLGFVNLTGIDWENRKCSWGFYIGEVDAPKGSGQIMAYLALNFAFDNLDLRKVCSEILEFNTRSYTFHQRLGFTQEGRLREHVYKKDGYVDVILMALFKDSWLSRRESLLKEWRRYSNEANNNQK